MMRRNTLLLIGLWLAAAAHGCGGGGGSGPAPAPSVTVVQAATPAEAPPVGLFINDVSTTFDLLDIEVGLDSDAARNITSTVATTATATLDDLDLIPEVGPVALERIERFAANWATPDPDPLLDYMNSPATTHAALDAYIISSTAQAIIDHKNGGDPFDSRSELDRIGGVGPATLQDIEAEAGLGRALAEDADTQDDLRAVAFAPDGTVALIVGRSDAGRCAYLYDTTGEDAFSGDAFTDDGKAGAPSATVSPFDLGDLGAKELVDVAWTPDGAEAIAVGEEGKVLRFIRETRTFTDASPLSLTTGLLSSVAISPTGNAALIADLENGRVLRYDLATGIYSVAVAAAGQAVRYSAQAVFAPLREKGLGIGTGPGGKLFAIQPAGTTELDARTGEDLLALAFDPTGRLGLACGSHGTGFALELSSVTVNGQPVALVSIDRLATRSIRDLRGAAVHPGGRYALLVGDAGEVLLEDLARLSSSRLTLRRVANPGELENRNFTGVAFEPKGSYALIVGDRGALFRYTR